MDSETVASFAAAPSPHAEEGMDKEREITKHAFVHVSMHPSWVKFPLEIRVNRQLEVSINGGAWHGSAIYENTTGKGIWTLTFHYKAKLDCMRVNKYEQMKGTAAYLQLVDDDNRYNSMLITKTDGLHP